jgi:hypothetical protein
MEGVTAVQGRKDLGFVNFVNFVILQLSHNPPLNVKWS